MEQRLRNLVAIARKLDGSILATYFALILAFVPVVTGAVNGYRANDGYSGATWSAFGALILFAIWFLRPARRPPKPKTTTIFQPLVDVQTLRPWPRIEATNQLIDRLMESKSKPVIVVGVSGAGKTVLLHRLLRERLADKGIASRYIDGYPSLYAFRTELAQNLDQLLQQALDRGESKPPLSVIILDQFEQYLAELKRLDREESQDEQQHLCHILTEQAPMSGAVFLISLRWEWYYELRWLGDLIPAPSECVEITGPPTDRPTDPTREAIVARFDQLFRNRERANHVVDELSREGRVLPLEAQIVGAALERLSKQGDVPRADLSLDRVGTVADGINAFFDGILDGAPNRRIALKVCCALSVHSRFRRQEELNTIVESVFESTADVTEALDYLIEQRVLVMRAESYELAHDYLADFFQRKSGAELDPPERDNTIFHMEGGTDNRSGIVPLVAERDEPGRGQFALWVIVPVCALITCRLFITRVAWTRLGFVPPHPVLGPVLDLSYAPIFVAHFAWAVYVVSLYRSLLARLDLGRRGTFFSQLTVVNMAACVVLAVFVPYAWMASIGWGGLLLGLRLFSLSAHPGLNIAARARIRGFAMVTVANLVFLAGLGAIGTAIAFHFVDDANTFRWWLLSCAYAGIVLTYSAYALGPIHLQPKAISQMLGLLARPSKTIVSRPEV